MIKKFLANKYISSLISTAFSSGVTFLSYPILAVVYSLDEFGRFAVINAYALIFSTLILFRFDYFLLNTKNNYQRIRYLCVGIFLCFFISIISIIAIIALVCLSDLDFKFFFYFCVITILLSLYNHILLFFVSNSMIAQLNLIKILRSLLIVFSQFVAFYFSSEDGLVVGLIVAMFMTCIGGYGFVLKGLYQYILLLRNKNIGFFTIISITIKEKIHDIKYQMPQTIINSLVNNSIVIVIEFFFGTQIAGAATITEKFIRMPISLVVDTFRPILISDFSRVNSSNKALDRLKTILLFSVFLSSLYVLIILLLNKTMILDAYTIWVSIKHLVMPVAFFSISALITMPIFCFFYSTNRSHLLFNLEITRFLLILILIFLVSLVNNLWLFYFGLGFIFVSVPMVYLKFILDKH